MATGVEFEINEVGETTQKTWMGTFSAKEQLSFRDRIQADKVKRDLLGPNPLGATDEVAAQCQILSELSVRLVKVPDWWRESKNGLDLVDDNILLTVYAKACEIQAEAIKKIQSEGEKAQSKLKEMKKNE